MQFASFAGWGKRVEGQALPSLESLQPTSTALSLLQQLPACGGAHAGARPRRGGLLPAVRVQVRGAEHHHHQGAQAPRPSPRPSPCRAVACTAPPYSTVLHHYLWLWGWLTGWLGHPQGPSSAPSWSRPPLTSSHLQGKPGRRAGDPFPPLSLFCAPLCPDCFGAVFLALCRMLGAQVACPLELPVW